MAFWWGARSKVTPGHTHTRLWRSGTLAAWTPVHPVVSDTSPDPGHPGQQCQTSQIPRTPWPPVSNLPDHSQTTAVSNLLDSRTPSSVRPPRPLYTQQCQTSPILVHPAVSDLPDHSTYNTTVQSKSVDRSKTAMSAAIETPVAAVAIREHNAAASYKAHEMK